MSRANNNPVRGANASSSSPCKAEVRRGWAPLPQRLWVSRDGGFSVVEALVALAVFAMAGVALVQLQAHSLTTLTRVERAALGAIVAQNQLVEAAASASPPELGEREGEAKLGGRDWRWKLRVEAASGAETRRVAVVVFAAPSGQQAAMAEAFVAAPGAAQ
jgi:general secretion pathway protein I